MQNRFDASLKWFYMPTVIHALYINRLVSLKICNIVVKYYLPFVACSVPFHQTLRDINSKLIKTKACKSLAKFVSQH